MEDILIDARGLDPPEPLERVLTALSRRKRNERVRLLLHREPFPLYDILRQMGLNHSVRQGPDGSYEIRIYEPTDELM
ncbi:MAG: DUF2249 domain-containing protein [Thiobacillaceae bacterium]